MRTLLPLALLLLSPAAALACEPPDPNRDPEDRPMTLWSDGSFQDASDDDPWWQLEGRPIRDIGGGRTGQVLRVNDCGPREALLFVDCTTGSAIMVWAEGGGMDRLTELSGTARSLQPPHGPIGLTPATTVAEVQALAARHGLQVRADVPEFARERGSRNAFDPFMGCEIFYPGSVGAGR